MRMLRRSYLIAVLLGLTAPCACGAEPAADRVLVNGNILTVDASDSVAQAVAIGGGRIVGVGTNSEIEAFMGPATDRIDLQGRTVTPGLLDAHLHLSSGGLSRITEADLSFPLVKSVGDTGKMRVAIADLRSGRRHSHVERLPRGAGGRRPVGPRVRPVALAGNAG
jgi:cytosine/adenosine deaminase-related metal-dependent hydrolase